MPPRWILLTLACVLLLAVGQLLFRVAAQQWHVEGWSLATARSFLSPTMLAALAIYGAATVLWVLVLRTTPLTLAYSLFALAFVVTPLMAHFVLGEPMGARTLIGAVIIVVGVVIATS
ncbi:MAG: EamA family transporter [Betaproteobacteria bacterium]